MSTSTSTSNSQLQSPTSPYMKIQLLDNPSSTELPDTRDLHHFLEQQPANSILPSSPKRELITIQSRSTIAEAVRRLASARILSAPVLNDDSTCMGFIDMTQIVYFATHVRIVSKEEKEHYLRQQLANKPRRRSSIEVHEDDGSYHNNHLLSNSSHNNFSRYSTYEDWRSSMNDLVYTAEEISNESIDRIFYSSPHSNTLMPFFESNPLYLLLELFGSGSIHRVALISPSFEILNTVSQSDMVNYIDKALHDQSKFPGIAQCKISSLPLPKRELVSIDEQVTASDAFAMMMEHRVSCLAIVHKETKALVAEFSAASLRGLSDFRMLRRNVVDFLRHTQTESSLVPLQCKMTDTFGSAIHKLATNRGHRVWVLDEKQYPIELLTATDILRLMGSQRTVSNLEANGDVDVKKLWRTPTSNIQHVDAGDHQFKFIVV
jgi:CBS-domain-containing membrane protein